MKSILTVMISALFAAGAYAQNPPGASSQEEVILNSKPQQRAQTKDNARPQGKVKKIGGDRVTLELVNLDPAEAREVVVQAGTFGEHQFTTVAAGDQRIDVNRRFFTVHLEPGAGITVEAWMKRFVNKPTYAFPWHRDRVPVR